MEDLVLNDESEILDKSTKCYNFSLTAPVRASQYNSRQIVKFTFLFIPSHSRFPFSVLGPPEVSSNQIIKPEKNQMYLLG